MITKGWTAKAREPLNGRVLAAILDGGMRYWVGGERPSDGGFDGPYGRLRILARKIR